MIFYIKWLFNLDPETKYILRRLKTPKKKFIRRTTGYSLLGHRRN